MGNLQCSPFPPSAVSLIWNSGEFFQKCKRFQTFNAVTCIVRPGDERGFVSTKGLSISSLIPSVCKTDLCALNQSQVWNICKLFSQWQPVIVDVFVFLVRKLTHGVWITCNNVGQKYLFGKLCFADVMYKDPATRIGVVWAFLWSYHHAISLH